VSEGPSFHLETTKKTGATLVTIDGEVDLTNADEVQRCVEDTSAAAVVLDLSGLLYLDSSGIRAIDRAFRHLRSEGRSLFIVSPEETPSGWTFRVAGFDPHLLFESLDAALATAARTAT
jgi:anti-anti-sigma factor